jgi:hypothetical protein
VVTLDAVNVAAISFAATIAAKTFEHEFDHVALAVMRRRHVREDEQFHFRLRFTAQPS